MISQAFWRPNGRAVGGTAPLLVTAAKASRLELADGRVLLDGAAGWWDACHGYNHPHIREAVVRQLRGMPHVLRSGLTHEAAENLADRLAGRLPGALNHVFFSETATGAVQAARKMAAGYWVRQGAAERRRFLILGDADERFSPERGGGRRRDFGGSGAPRSLTLAYPSDAEGLRLFEQALERELPTLAAIIVEPLIERCEGLPAPAPGTLRAILAWARAHGVLTIANETFTGFGRLGTMFAFEQSPAVPDLVCLSKALTGGFLPLAAVVASDRIFEAFAAEDPGEWLYGSSGTPSPMACAAACASLDLFEFEPRIDQAQSMQRKLRDGLKACQSLNGVSVRTKGALAVVRLDWAVDAERLGRALFDRGVCVRAAAGLVHLAPALNIADEDLSELCSVVGSVLKSQRLSLRDR